MTTTTTRACRTCGVELQTGLRGRPRVYCTTCKPPRIERAMRQYVGVLRDGRQAILQEVDGNVRITFMADGARTEPPVTLTAITDHATAAGTHHEAQLADDTWVRAFSSGIGTWLFWTADQHRVKWVSHGVLEEVK